MQFQSGENFQGIEATSVKQLLVLEILPPTVGQTLQNVASLSFPQTISANLALPIRMRLHHNDVCLNFFMFANLNVASKPIGFLTKLSYVR
jgi:hypothetical protein